MTISLFINTFTFKASYASTIETTCAAIGISSPFKPSSLTKEEMEVMKSHVIIGAKMLNSLPFYNDEPIVKYGYQICRWHHERYDGNGYQDGLKGEEIPIAAQVVS